ncbi:MAG TPA: hypothetical protein PL124_07480 [Candidatus Cloacimonadota bacterium]|nr:hypothetical protein [Candidatus Cloacimonadota bacterium]HPS39238.1 hypothetical protein [Candidatus Cloacimonadota bacterium]
MFQLAMYLLGLLIGILIGLVVYVWKTSQAEVRALRVLNDKLDEKAIAIERRVATIESRCMTHDKTDVSETALRKIVREELQASMETFSDSFTLKLIENGYITTPKQRKANTKP